MVNITLSALACIPNGIDKPWAINMNSWVNSMLLAFSFLPIAAWIAYVDHKIFNNFDSIRKHVLIYMIPFFIAVVIVALNSTTKWLFTIEEGNVYTRQVGVQITAIITYFLLFILFLSSRRFKKRLNVKLLKVVFLFMLFPVTASILQIIFPELRILWPSFVFATFMAFLLLEKDAMLKDSLTKLNTRAALEARVKQKLRRHEPFSLIMIDLDDFKQVNDTYGHKAGDDALMVVASILEESVKRTDMVCRYGGDEFLILVESLRTNASTYIRERIKSKISAFNKKNIKPYTIAMSFGLKFYNKKNINLKHLMAEIDQLMYVDKEKNQKSKLSEGTE